jgi:hypothetical protein
MSHPSEETLNDHVDGLLSASELLEVRRHLGECADCTRSVDELQRIVHAAAALGEVEPPRNLLPGIRAAVARPGRGWLRWAAAAALIGFVAVLAASRFGGTAPKPPLATLLADFHAAEADYVRATEMLSQGLEERRDQIEPATLDVLDANLALIDAAIAEVRVALDRDGLGVENTHLLATLYNKKLDILMRASRLAS